MLASIMYIVTTLSGCEPHTYTAMVTLRGREAHFTFTSVAAGVIYTLAIFTQRIVQQALIYIWKLDQQS